MRPGRDRPRRLGAALTGATLLVACTPNTGPAGPLEPGERCSRLDAAAPLVAEQQTVLLGGDGRYPVYRIPAAVTTGRGTVLVFSEARPSLADPGSGHIDLVLRRSDDCGRSWGPIQLVDDAGADDAHNPTAVVVPDTGVGERVLLFSGRRPASPGGEFDLPSGFGPGAARMLLRTSDDDGRTWSEPRDLTSEIKDASWRVASFGPGRGIVTRWGTGRVPPGRIVVPGWYSADGIGEGAFVALSDDGGETWRRRNLPAPFGTGEPQVVELTDGTLLVDARATGARQLFRSSDGGETWTGPGVGLPMTPIMSGILRDRAMRDGDGFDRLLHSGVATDGRYGVRVWTSRDEGTSWDGPTVLIEGVAQYSMLTPLGDGTVGLVHEATCLCDDGSGYRVGWGIRFLRVDPDRLDPSG